jgi:signal transduction histidine kinase
VPPLFGARQGVLVPEWDAGVLTFGRKVERAGESAYQVFRFDWPALETHLLSVVGDLFPDARLEPLAPDAPPAGDRLATLPARLVVPRALSAAPLDRGLVAALGGAWLLALLAATGAAFALRASLADAARQRRFTAAVTHELRTPLTTFRLYGEMLAHGMVPPERQREYLATIEREAARLGGLVENVLAYARLERGHTRPPRQRVRLDALVERHRASLEQRCLRAGTALEVELGAASAVELMTDVEGVGLVLANLVDNACKYGAPAGGHAPGRPIRLRASLTPDAIALAVEDDGPGVPPTLRATIFRPFERGGRGESDPAPGVGLGLALAREVARALDGELAFEPGPGARFVLRLPRA